VKEDLYLLLSFYNTYTYYYIYQYTTLVQKHRTNKYPVVRGMTISFENDKDVIIYALEIIISSGRENLYLFVANCASWIAGVIGLDLGLNIYIDTLQEKTSENFRKGSITPRDLQEDSRTNEEASYNEADIIIASKEQLVLRTKGSSKQARKKNAKALRKQNLSCVSKNTV